jgi:hypothetical protein
MKSGCCSLLLSAAAHFPLFLLSFASLLENIFIHSNSVYDLYFSSSLKCIFLFTLNTEFSWTSICKLKVVFLKTLKTFFLSNLKIVIWYLLWVQEVIECNCFSFSKICCFFLISLRISLLFCGFIVVFLGMEFFCLYFWVPVFFSVLRLNGPTNSEILHHRLFAPCFLNSNFSSGMPTYSCILQLRFFFSYFPGNFYTSVFPVYWFFSLAEFYIQFNPPGKVLISVL